MSDYAPASRAPEVPIEDVVWRIDGPHAGDKDSARARFVPYIDSRTVADLLDQWVGPWNWRALFEPATVDGKNAMFCHVEIRVPARTAGEPTGTRTDEWIRKTDVGSPTGFESQKGIVSDSFKRAACIQWGVGRNVYDLPGDIWAPVAVGGNGKPRANDKSVPAILAELKKRGFNLETAKAETEGRITSDKDATPDDLEPIDDATFEKIKAMFDALPNSERNSAKKQYASKWGDPKKLPAAKLDEAMRDVNAIIVAHTPDPVEPAESQPPAPGSAPAAAPPAVPVPPPAEAAGTPTPEQIAGMDLRTITPLLAEHRLEATGKLEEKRRRLTEHLHGEPAQDTVDASIEQYLAGITQYEEQLDGDQTTAWYAWWFDAFGEATQLDKVEDAKAAYDYIRNMVEGDTPA